MDAHIVALTSTPPDSSWTLIDAPLPAVCTHVPAPQGIDAAAEWARQVTDGAQVLAIDNRLTQARRLAVCLDCDSTLITGEVIEMLADHAGKREEVAEVTRRAMEGELDFADSLWARVATLAGLDAGIIDEVAAGLELTTGAQELIAALHADGHVVGVVSGGFIQVLKPLAAQLRLDAVAANTLEVVDGTLTGRVRGGVVDKQEKARFLARLAQDFGADATVAVGDGANDCAMVAAADLGVALCGKPALREVADVCLDVPRLDALIPLLGLSAAVPVADGHPGDAL